jgi:hypothetical protein
MPGRYSVRAFSPHNPAIQEMANVCASGEEYTSDRRADANEVSLVAGALTAVALDAVRYDYPELVFRQLAPLQDGLTPGTENYRWDELDVRGMASIIANYADDLPDVSAYTKQNTGIIRSLGDSFQYTTQDVRRVLESRRQGRQTATLDVDRVVLAREIMERKKDQICAYGDPLYQLPGILKNTNVTLLTASTPAGGGTKRWVGGTKIGTEVLRDLRSLLQTVRTQSKGVHTPNVIVMPIEEFEAISTMPLITGSENQVLVLEQFLRSQAGMGRPVEIITWNRASTADAAGTGPRILAYERSPRTVRLVEPLDFEAQAPQRVNLSFKIPCEARFGGIFFKRPLSGAYMDFV